MLVMEIPKSWLTIFSPALPFFSLSLIISKTYKCTVSSLNSCKLYSQPVCSLYKIASFLDENSVIRMTYSVAQHFYLSSTLKTG